MKVKEYVIGVNKAALIEELNLVDGLNLMGLEDVYHAMNKLGQADQIVCQERSKIETNTDVLQLLPYIAVTDSIAAFHHDGVNRRWLSETIGVYKRKDKVGEQRLVGKYSIGIGGHIEFGDYAAALKDISGRVVDPTYLQEGAFEGEPLPLDIDTESFVGLLRQAVCREVDEELQGGLASIENISFAGLILDRSDAVGNVHIGLAFIAIRPPNLHTFTMNEAELEVIDPVAVPFSIVRNEELYNKFENWSKIFLDTMADRFLLGAEMLEYSHLLDETVEATAGISKTHCVVPRIPDETQWGGLARDIMMAWDCQCDTPRKLFKHLERSGKEIPQWLRDESEMKNLDHVPSKGTRAAIIYRAMVEEIQIDDPVNPDIGRHDFEVPTERATAQEGSEPGFDLMANIEDDGQGNLAHPDQKD